MHLTKTPILNPLQPYKIEDFVRCGEQKEWICDNCLRCGDPDCCTGGHTLFRLPRVDFSLCSICLKGVQ